MEADIFGPAGFPRLPGLGRPDAMEFEGDDTGGTLHTEVGGQPTDMTYTPTDVTPTDVGFTMPEAAEAYSAYEFEGTVPEEAAQQMLTDAAERTGGDPPGDDPIPEEDLKSTITLVVYTMEGSFEEVQAALREACGDTVMAMGPVMVSTEVQGAMATLTPVEGQELVQISIVKMEAPKALESLLPGGGGVRMGQPGGMLRRGPRGPGGPGGPGRPGGPRGPGPGGPGQDG
jgi:NACalpha-BTF3-like transcription factor